MLSGQVMEKRDGLSRVPCLRPACSQPNFTTGVFQKVFETFLVTFFPFPCVCVLVHILG